MIQLWCFWFLFVYFFKSLKRQNFFNHLILNRSFYIPKFEILSFVLSIFVVFISINCLFFPFIGLENINLFLLLIAQIIIDALLFSVIKFNKYIFIQFVFVLFIIILFLLSHHLSINFNNLEDLSLFSDKYYIFFTFIEFIFITKNII